MPRFTVPQLVGHHVCSKVPFKIKNKAMPNIKCINLYTRSEETPPFMHHQ